MSNAKRFRYVKDPTRYHTYLNKVRDRLKTDVGPYITYTQNVAKTEGKGVGNFSLFRMIMPVIETVATVSDQKPQLLLEKLGIPCPYIFWSLFRDGFVHNDEFINGITKFNGIIYGITPGISTSSPSSVPPDHYTDSQFLIINPAKIYYDLLSYIDEELKGPNNKIDVTVAIEYFDVQDAEIKNIRSEIQKNNQLY